jgi:hypothetical protein
VLTRSDAAEKLDPSNAQAQKRIREKIFAGKRAGCGVCKDRIAARNWVSRQRDRIPHKSQGGDLASDSSWLPQWSILARGCAQNGHNLGGN